MKKDLNIELLLDKSGSMAEKDCRGGKTRWLEGQEQTLALASKSESVDADGITVVTFNRSFKVYEGVTSAKVSQIFTENEPGGGTDTAAVLKNRLDAFFARKAAGCTKPCLLLVMTDGAPDDQKAVANVIIDATKKLERDEELAIQFVQIGSDPWAKAFLAYLDDELVKMGAAYDIVDTTSLDATENMTLVELIEKSFAD